VLQGKIRSVITEVETVEIVANCRIDFKVSVTRAAVRHLHLEVGSDVYLLIKARALHVLA